MKIAKKVFVNQLNRLEASGTNEEQKHKESKVQTTCLQQSGTQLRSPYNGLISS